MEQNNSKYPDFLTSFKRAKDQMIATNETSYNGEWGNRRYRQPLKDYTQEEIEKIIDSGSLPEQQKLSRTYFYKDVIVKAVEQLQESSSEESYQELIEDLNNDYSQFYFDIARNGYDVGLKTFHSCINISHQTKNPQDTVLQQRIGIKDANRNYRQEGLLIADYITENQTRKEMTQVKQKAMNY